MWRIRGSELDRLQNIQNTAARIVSHIKGRDHFSPVLKDLHWLPIRQHINHKILSLTFSCLNGLAPDYLAESIPRYLSTRSLCSNSQSLLILPSQINWNSVENHSKTQLQCCGIHYLDTWRNQKRSNVSGRTWNLICLKMIVKNYLYE